MAVGLFYSNGAFIYIKSFVIGDDMWEEYEERVLNSMRSSKEHGQSNFTNPGIFLLGAGVDMDILPELRLTLNANYLAFAETEVLEVARNQGNVDEEIGLDLSAAIIWRPFMSQNVVLRLSYAQLLAGDGFNDLYGDEDPFSLLFNLILTY